MKILLTGANSYLGCRLFFDLNKKYEVIGTYHQQKLHPETVFLDVTDHMQVEKIVGQYRPDVIVHNANFASPKPALDNPEGYIALNKLSAEYICRAAESTGAKVLFISSFAALNPDTIYGQMKLQSEEIVQSMSSNYLIIRPSLIVGYSPNTFNDKFFNRVLKCVEERKVKEFDTSWKCQPTYIGHLTEIISLAIEKEVRNRILHVFCPEIKSKYDIARDILSKFEIDVKPVDDRIVTPITVRNEIELRELGLPTYGYLDMIQRVVHEINYRKSYDF